MRCHHWFVRGLLIGLVCSGTFAGSAALVAAEEATRESCDAAVAEVRLLAAGLPADHGSRYFAERDLQQAMVEAGNGEFDDCLEAVARATDELRYRRHTLQPGERLNVLQPNEVPPR